MKNVPLALLAWFALSGLAHADDDVLYRSSLIVTGDREETRIPAIPQGFELAAQKLTGNPDIAQNPLFASLAIGSPGMVWSYTYHDRMFGIPIHDEQGTRDRPFDLTFQFDRKRMDEAMARLGEKPWLGARPRLAVVVEVTNTARSYVLAADGEYGSDQRASFEDASARFAIPVVFARQADLSGEEITPQRIDNIPTAALNRLKSKLGADKILVGHLDLQTNAPGWHASWHLASIAKDASWEIAGVNFDAAFRNGVGGAAKRLRPPN